MGRVNKQGEFFIYNGKSSRMLRESVWVVCKKRAPDFVFFALKKRIEAYLMVSSREVDFKVLKMEIKLKNSDDRNAIWRMYNVRNFSTFFLWNEF